MKYITEFNILNYVNLHICYAYYMRIEYADLGCRIET